MENRKECGAPKMTLEERADGFVRGLKNIRSGGQKTRKIERVTGSQDDDFVG
jgi:hypothetical protein